MQRLTLLFLVSAISSLALGQSNLELRNNLYLLSPQGDTLKNAWNGAMEVPNFANFDLNRDGLQDIVVYDAADQSFTPYVYEGKIGVGQMRYAPEYKALFRNCECDLYALSVDIDLDGDYDLVCGINNHVRVYQNQPESDRARFVLRYDRLEENAPFAKVTVDRTTLPGFADVDADGDVDILSVSIFWGMVAFHENLSQDLFNHNDSLVFADETYCWGHVTQLPYAIPLIAGEVSQGFCQLGAFDPSTSGCRNPSGAPSGPTDPRDPVELHASGTILPIDFDSDGVYDFLSGAVDYPYLRAAYNCGTNDYAYIDSTEARFPSYDQPAFLQNYVAPYYVDVDADGTRDLIAGVFAEPDPTDVNSPNNIQSTLLYYNRGLDASPQFNFQERGYLQNKGLEFGRFTSPAFLDYNNDGLQDLIIGHGGWYDTTSVDIYPSGLVLLENVGTQDRAIFKVVDEDYLGLRAAPYPGFTMLAPTVGDIDGDNDPDLLVGYSNGSFAYYRNVAPFGQVADFRLVTDTYGNLNVLSNAKPALFDFDQDGDLDLFSGNERGLVSYFRNEGSAMQANFVAVTDSFGGVQALTRNAIPFRSYSAPLFFDYTGDGKVDLLLGAEDGTFTVYDDARQGLNRDLASLGRAFRDGVGGHAVGTAAIIDSTGNYTVVVGTRRGGLMLYNSLPLGFPRTPDSMSASLPRLTAASLQLQPNPAQDQLRVRLQLPGNPRYTLSLFDATGRRLWRAAEAQRGITTIDLASFPPGIYLVEARTSKGRVVRKLRVE